MTCIKCGQAEAFADTEYHVDGGRCYDCMAERREPFWPCLALLVILWAMIFAGIEAMFLYFGGASLK